MPVEGRGQRPDDASGESRPVVYCLIPPDLAPRLHNLLRDHFADQPQVEVVVERRDAERRSGEERRRAEGAPPGGPERRQVRAAAGRRSSERRASQLPVTAPELPRRARRFAERLSFVERLEPPTQELEDRDTLRLVARFQAGDREAFTAIYTRYLDRVYGYMRVALRDSHEAEDAAQQIFINLLGALPEFEPRRPFRAWLFTIVRNHALNRLRDSARVEVMDPERVDRWMETNDADEPSLGGLDWITDRELLLFVERLPDAQRQVLVLRYVLDLSAAEIAQVIHRNTDDVRMLQHRAHRFLRERLAAVGRGPAPERRTRMRTRMREATVLRARRFSLH